MRTIPFFRSSTPLTPAERLAKRQLVFTNQAITEISYDLGFSDPSHFARFFRKNTAMTPLEFRAHRGG